MRFLNIFLTIISMFFMPALGQEKQEKTEKKTGMFWHWFDGAKKCSVEWDQAVVARKEAFAYLAKKVGEGDQNKIQRAMSEAQYSKPDMGLAWACGSDYSRNLKEWAGSALAPGSTYAGVATEKEYDEAMSLVKTLREKIKARPLTAEHRKIWEDAVRAVGAFPESPFYKFIE